MSKLGKIILLESGTDGAGKATQANLLTNALVEKGHKVLRVDFPRYQNDSSILIKKYLNGDFGKNANDVNPYTASTFYAVDRFASYLEEWRSFYEAGGIIVLDRYSSSNMIYQGAKIRSEEELIDYVNWLNDLEHTKGGLPQADYVLYLDVPPLVSEKLRLGRDLKNQGTVDIHEENTQFMNDCYKTGSFLCDYYDWTRIDCTNSDNQLLNIEEIHSKIMEKLPL